MPKLIMLKGLPASGKSTWAKKEVAANKGQVKRVNKDDLRAMIDGGMWSKKNESEILSIRDKIIVNYLQAGYDVIVDDTNLAPKHKANLQHIAEELEAEFEEKSFLDVSLKTCIMRDIRRDDSVGEKVIKNMYNQFLKPTPKPYVFSPDKPNCIIVDIDGTVAHMAGRSPYDYSQVHTDTPDEIIREIVQRYAGTSIMDETPGTYIVIVSGREDGCKEVTEQWLKDNQIPYDEIFMRKHGDMRNDTIVKKEIFDTWIKDRYNVRFVLDDRDRVVDMWRNELGLKVLQVAEGDF